MMTMRAIQMIEDTIRNKCLLNFFTAYCISMKKCTEQVWDARIHFLEGSQHVSAHSNTFQHEFILQKSQRKRPTPEICIYLDGVPLNYQIRLESTSQLGDISLPLITDTANLSQIWPFSAANIWCPRPFWALEIVPNCCPWLVVTYWCLFSKIFEFCQIDQNHRFFMVLARENCWKSNIRIFEPKNDTFSYGIYWIKTMPKAQRIAWNC